MTQNRMIISHLLRTGSITQREAMLDYSVQSLTKRISELRALGYKIKSEKKNHPTTGQRYVRYVLTAKKAK
jgi:biotin operon repressor